MFKFKLRKKDKHKLNLKAGIKIKDAFKISKLSQNVHFHENKYIYNMYVYIILRLPLWS